MSRASFRKMANSIPGVAPLDRAVPPAGHLLLAPPPPPPPSQLLTPGPFKAADMRRATCCSRPCSPFLLALFVSAVFASTPSAGRFSVTDRPRPLHNGHLSQAIFRLSAPADGGRAPTGGAASRRGDSGQFLSLFLFSSQPPVCCPRSLAQIFGRRLTAEWPSGRPIDFFNWIRS